MKKYLQKLAVAVLACAGFASCADEFDATDHASYPAEAPGLGTWVADQSATSGPFTKDYFCELNITLSSAGDTVYNITTVSTPYNQYGLPADYPICAPAGRLAAYDDTTGVTLLEFDQVEEGNVLGIGLTPGRAHLAYSRAWDKLTVDLDFYYNNNWYPFQNNAGSGTFTLTKAARPSFVNGYWFGQGSDGSTYVFYLTYTQQQQVGVDAEGNPVTVTFSGQCVVGNAQDLCTYAYDKTTGTATVTTVPMPGTPAQQATTYTLQYNEIGQLTYSTGTETVILDRMAY